MTQTAVSTAWLRRLRSFSTWAAGTVGEAFFGLVLACSWIVVGLCVVAPLRHAVLGKLPADVAARLLAISDVPSFAAAIGFPVLTLILREVVHARARNMMYDDGLDAVPWPAPFDWTLFPMLFGRWYVLAVLAFAFNQNRDEQWNAILVLGPALVCVYGYSRQSFFEERDVRFPLSGFPLTNIFAVATVYALVAFAAATQAMRSVLGLCGTEAFAHAWWLVTFHLGCSAVVGIALVGLGIHFGRVRRGNRPVTFAIILSLALGLMIVAGQLATVWLFPTVSNPTGLWSILFSAKAWGLAWFLALLPSLALTPILMVARQDESVAMRGKELCLLTVRGLMVLITIVRDNIILFAISVPVSMALAVEPLVHWMPEGTASVSWWFATTAAWLAPFINGLFFLDDTFARAYAYGLRRALMDLRDHLLVLGYGDIGRRLVEQQLSNRIMVYNTLRAHLHGSRNLLLPDGRFAKLLTRVAAVEIDATLLRSASRTPDGLTIATADVSDVVRLEAQPPGAARRSPALWDYRIPVVVGDATLEEVQNLARLEKAAFVAALIRGSRSNSGPDPSQLVFRRLQKLARNEGRFIPAGLVIHSSAHIPYVAARTLRDRLPLHYVFPEHLEGLSVANLVSAACLKFREHLPDAPPRILLCSHGRRLFYLVDSFLKTLPARDYERFAENQQRQAHVLALGIERVLDVPATEHRGLAAERETPATDGMLAELRRQRLRVGAFRFSRFLSRTPREVFGTHEAGGFRPESEVLVPCVRHDPWDYEAVRVVLKTFEPDVIVVSDQDAHAELRALQSIINNVARRAGEAPSKPLPLLLIGGETGSHPLKKNLQTALVYYASLWRSRQPDARSTIHPTPAMFRSEASEVPDFPRGFRREFRGDPFIDVLDEPTERLGGLIRAYVRSSEAPRGSGRLPVQLDLCGAEQAGYLACTLARLSGYDPDTRPTQRRPPSLCNSRAITQPNGWFMIRGSLRLDGREPFDPERSRHVTRLVVTCGNAGVEPGDLSPMDYAASLMRLPSTQVAQDAQRAINEAQRHADQARELHDEAKEEDAKKVEKEKEQAWHRFGQLFEERYLRQMESCCGMPHCPVEGFHKIIESAQQELLQNMIETPANRYDHARKLCQRFLAHEQGPLDPPSQDDSPPPFATVRIDCEGGNLPGTFAIALNALVFRRLVAPANWPERIFNLTYMSDYECHDGRFAVATLYGTLEAPAKMPTVRSLESVVRRIEIKPVTTVGAWERYASELVAFLNADIEPGRQWDLAHKPEPDKEDLRGLRLTIEHRSVA